jgi:hypothetical protein
MFSKLPELCCVHFSNNEVEIFSTKNHTCNINKNIDVLEDENSNVLLYYLLKLYFKVNMLSYRKLRVRICFYKGKKKI